MELAIRAASARSYADDVHDSGCELSRVIESHIGQVTLPRVSVQSWKLSLPHYLLLLACIQMDSGTGHAQSSDVRRYQPTVCTKKKKKGTLVL